MKVLFCTNLPSPYRVDFFNKLGQQCSLTVCYERHTASNRDAKWTAEQAKSFQEVYLPLKPLGEESGFGGAMRRFIRDNAFDKIFLSNYNSPACMEAIAYCRWKKIPYCMEYDGGLFKEDNRLLRMLKQWLLKPAQKHYTTCNTHIAYLRSLGVTEESIVKYPFSSLSEADMEKNEPLGVAEKVEHRKKLGFSGKTVILAVGQFIPRKGFDVLMESARRIPKEVDVCFVGGQPTEDYLRMKEEYGLDNVRFVGFCEKTNLAEYYHAADLFVLPTRTDIWGLVVNEAMSFGLPVVTTDRCAAGIELIENGVNGYVLPVDDVDTLADVLRDLCENPAKITKMGQAARKCIERYTVENMAAAHIEAFREEGVL